LVFQLLFKRIDHDIVSALVFPDFRVDVVNDFADLIFEVETQILDQHEHNEEVGKVDALEVVQGIDFQEDDSQIDDDAAGRTVDCDFVPDADRLVFAAVAPFPGVADLEGVHPNFQQIGEQADQRSQLEAHAEDEDESHLDDQLQLLFEEGGGFDHDQVLLDGVLLPFVQVVEVLAGL